MPEQTPTSSKPTLFSPEGVLMLGVALFADIVVAIFCLTLDIFFGLGELVAWVFDIIFTIILGGWMYIRGGGRLTGRKKFTKFLRKRVSWMAVEYVPFVGNLFPSWTINVVLFLRESPNE